MLEVVSLAARRLRDELLRGGARGIGRRGRVDPGDDAARRRRRAGRSRSHAARRSSSPTATSTTSAPSRDLAAATGVRGVDGARRRRRPAQLTDRRPTSPTTWSAAATTLDGRRHHFRVFDVPGHTAGVGRLRHRRRCLLRRRAVRRLGRPHRPAPAATLETLLASIALLMRELPPRHRVAVRPRARPRPSQRELADQPVPREPAVSDAFQPPRGTTDWCGEDAAARRHVDRSRPRCVRAGRLRRGGDAGVRGHRAVRPLVGRDVGRRQQGDVHLRGPQRPVADPAPREHRRRHARLPRRHERGSRSRSSSGTARATTATTRVQRGRAPRALPVRRRGDRVGGPGGRRRGDRAAAPLVPARAGCRSCGWS